MRARRASGASSSGATPAVRSSVCSSPGASAAAATRSVLDELFTSLDPRGPASARSRATSVASRVSAATPATFSTRQDGASANTNASSGRGRTQRNPLSGQSTYTPPRDAGDVNGAREPPSVAQSSAGDRAARTVTFQTPNSHSSGHGHDAAGGGSEGRGADGTRGAHPRQGDDVDADMSFGEMAASTREMLRPIVRSTAFEAAILGVIVANTIVLCLANPVDKSASRHKWGETLEMVFLWIFTVEALLKIFVLRLFGSPSAYLSDPWNVLDGGIVLIGWVAETSVLGDTNVSAVRVVRVFRLLRSIKSLPGLRVLIDSFAASVPQLLNVAGLCAFVFFLFGIAGVQLLAGRLNQRCFLPAGTNGSTSPVLAEPDDLKLCRLADSGAGRACPVVDGVQSVCMHGPVNPNRDITSFDNTLVAFLTIFQCISLEGWVDIMYWVRAGALKPALLVSVCDGMWSHSGVCLLGACAMPWLLWSEQISETGSRWFSLYFIVLILFGSLFLLNLVVAVITINLTVQTKTSRLNSKRANDWAMMARLRSSRSTGDVLSAVIAAKYAIKVGVDAQNAAEVRCRTHPHLMAG